MDNSIFQKASKKQAKLRLAIFGASGSGKTYSALSIATGLGGKIALIDTERRTASKYSDTFDFFVADLQPANIDNYVKFINKAEGCDVLIIDSLSHGWQELLEEVDNIARTKYKGNKWGAWSEGTPKQKKLVNAILNFNGHVIATMRCKTEWLVDKDERTGKNRPIRIGTSPEQGKGIEYEFDMLMNINTEHFAAVIKDRTGKYQDKFIEKPGKNLGKELSKWLNSGEKVEIISHQISNPKSIKQELINLCLDLCNGDVEQAKEFLEKESAYTTQKGQYLPGNKNINELSDARIEFTLNSIKKQNKEPYKVAL